MDHENALDQVISAKRTMALLDVTLLWTGINACLPTLMLGAILVPALSVSQALLVIGGGSLFLSLIIYLAGLPGVERGMSSPLIARSVLGYPIGTVLPALAIITSMSGWSAILLSAGAQAAAQVTPFSSMNIVIILTGISAGFAALMGEKAIRWSNLISVPLIFILFIWMSAVLWNRFPITGLFEMTGNGSFGLMHGFDLIVGGTIAGAFVSSDLGRFALNKRALGVGIMLGNIPINMALGLLGIMSRLATGNWNPIAAVGSLGMGLPALVLVVLTVLTTIQPSIYSGGLAFANLFPGLDRRVATVIVCLPALLLALAGISDHFEEWLIMLNLLLVPLVGILIAAILWPSKQAVSRRISYPALGGIILGVTSGLIHTPLPQSILSMGIAALAYLLIRKMQHHHVS